MIERYLLHPVIIPPSLSSSGLAKHANIVITPDGYGIAEKLAQLLRNQGYSQVSIVATLPAVCDVAVVLDGLCHFLSQDQAIAINKHIFQQVRNIAAHFTEHGGRLLVVQDNGGQLGLSATPHWQPWAAGWSGLVKTAALEWPKASCCALDVQIADQTPERLARRIMDEILGEGVPKECGVMADGRRMTLHTIKSAVPSPLVGEGGQHLFLATKRKTNQSANSTEWSHLKIARNRCGPDEGLSWFTAPAYPTSVSLRDPPSPTRGEGLPVVIVTGGARGVTASCIIGLAKKQPMRLALLGRTPLEEETMLTQAAQTEAELKQVLFADYSAQKISVTPKQINQQVSKILANRDIHANIKILIASGCEVRYLPVDVADHVALAQALQEIRLAWGAIHGIIHGAGVLADKWIAQKTDEQFDLVFNTKILGLKNLLELTQADPLQLIVFFSSVAARFGNPGQCDYAMANEVLNKVAQQQQRLRKQCVVKSINWGPWAGGMVTAQLQHVFAERGVALIDIAEGVERFVQEVLSPRGENAVEVVIGGDLNPQHSDSESVTTLQIAVDANSHPYLADHAVKGAPVVPACLVLEWFAQAALARYPRLKIVEYRQIKVLRGIRLTQFQQAPPQLFTVSVVEKTSGSHHLFLSLTAQDSALPCYTGEVLLAERNQPAALVLSADEGTVWPYSIAMAYDESQHPQALFHGPKFQMLADLYYISDHGGLAKLKSIAAMQWADQFNLDILALDGALQLFVLWNGHHLQKKSVPMSIGSLRICSEKPVVTAEKRCVFRAQANGNHAAIFDAIISDDHNVSYAEFKGVEVVCYD